MGPPLFIMGGACLSWVGFQLGFGGGGHHWGSKACQVPLLRLVWAGEFSKGKEGNLYYGASPLYHGWGLPEVGWVLTWIWWRGPPQEQQGMPDPPPPPGLGRGFFQKGGRKSNFQLGSGGRGHTTRGSKACKVLILLLVWACMEFFQWGEKSLLRLQSSTASKTAAGNFHTFVLSICSSYDVASAVVAAAAIGVAVAVFVSLAVDAAVIAPVAAATVAVAVAVFVVIAVDAAGFIGVVAAAAAAAFVACDVAVGGAVAVIVVDAVVTAAAVVVVPGLLLQILSYIWFSSVEFYLSRSKYCR